jgi:hypothetical protein
VLRESGAGLREFGAGLRWFSEGMREFGGGLRQALGPSQPGADQRHETCREKGDARFPAVHVCFPLSRHPSFQPFMYPVISDRRRNVKRFQESYEMPSFLTVPSVYVRACPCPSIPRSERTGRGPHFARPTMVPASGWSGLDGKRSKEVGFSRKGASRRHGTALGPRGFCDAPGAGPALGFPGFCGEGRNAYWRRPPDAKARHKGPRGAMQV